ncbi:hypothetical protein FNH13_16080 [Ornithinimicrobium ciconiae]|uniref:Uncharacterized protein n=1 Tax=Ornithinimicrobium ciconiae TaxID=2594265 RepID=A0A516GDQ4_9MICO|nr:hypothetical protein [Ornithinimicrobium ciconiae]QDO89665.1 hypothetical protein FNH13_16080 [Ornithinimicrobium ciconiae]
MSTSISRAAALVMVGMVVWGHAALVVMDAVVLSVPGGTPGVRHGVVLLGVLSGVGPSPGGGAGAR